MAQDLGRLPPNHPYRARFGLITGVLIGIGIAVVAGTVLALAGGLDRGPRYDTGWAVWHPSADSGAGAIDEIAEHIAGRYRQGGGRLVSVDGAGLALPVAIRRSPRSGVVATIKQGRGVVYTMRGLGANGSIDVGEPSAARKLLLRRQALELALHTFRYVGEADQVMIVLPPPPVGETAGSSSSADSGATGTTGAAPSDSSSTAPGSTQLTETLYFRPGDLRAQLEQPLARTLSERPIEPSTFREPERTRVELLTRDHLFGADIRPGDDGEQLVLSPLRG